jgi:SAM-dependent methyltransferase
MTRGSWWGHLTAYRGMVETLKQGGAPARALAIADSRTLVRALFLASAVSSGVLEHLGDGPTLAEVVRRTGCRRPERLEAWLAVGTDLGELGCAGGRYRVRGRRARALSGGDGFLRAHYRSMLEYQVGPYADLAHLLDDDPGAGRDDLGRYADDIARVSLAAAPFVAALVRQTVLETRPARVLDIGCGSGAYSRLVLETAASAEVDGVDVAPGVVEAARRDLAAAGLGSRARLHAADIRPWLRQRQSGAPFDLVLLLNNIYYFERSQRPALYQEIRAVLADRGQLLVVSMTAPGSVAAAHLNFMLVCQEGAASLPGRDEVALDLAAAGYAVLGGTRLVPTEPFFATRATSGPDPGPPGVSPCS